MSKKSKYTNLRFNSLFDLHLVVPFDDLFLAAILQFSHNYSVHMPQCLAFGYFIVDYKKQSM